MRKLIASVFATGVLAVGIGAPAASAQPLVTGGLVNVTITNVLNNNEILNENNVGVAAALALAANVCDVNVNVLAVQLREDAATCTNRVTNERVTITQNQ